MFRLMVCSFLSVIALFYLAEYDSKLDPVEEFLSGRSNYLSGYGMGPVMSGLK